jgi:hypothetical protein
MKYKVIGFAVWNGGKWYIRRRYGDTPRKLFAVGVIAAALTGTVVAQRRIAVTKN